MSLVYTGSVSHRRLASPGTHSDAEHAFSYPIHYACLDLDVCDAELSSGGLAWLSTLGAAVFDPKDHLRREAFAAAAGEDETRNLYDVHDSTTGRGLAERGVGERVWVEII